MDLPPPPLFRRSHHHHLRYGNVLHPPEFITSPYSHPPPPPPPPPQPLPHRILFPPPPPPPPSAYHIAPTPFPPRFTFSPPGRPIIERSRIDEFDPPPEPYFDRTLHPPPPPPRPTENTPLRFIHHYPERNPIIRDEVFARDCVVNRMREFPEFWDRNLLLGERELHARVSDIDIGEHDKRHDIFYRNRELRVQRENSERWGSGIGWGSDLYNRIDYEERRPDNVMYDHGRELYCERDYVERRWDSAEDDERRWDSVEGGDDERRWDSVEGGDDERRWGSRANGFIPEFGIRGQEFVENDLRFDRFRGRLGKGDSKGEAIRSNQKKSALHRIQFGNDCSSPSRGYKRRPFPKRSNRASFKGKKKGVESLQTGTEIEREREQSPVELAISFKSNSLVARAILTPSRPAVVESDVKSISLNKRLVYTESGSPSAKTDKDVVLDLSSDSQKTLEDLQDKAAVSEAGSLTANDVGVSGEGDLKNSNMKVSDLQESDIVTSVMSRSSRLRRKRRARKQLMHETNLQMEKNSDDIVNVKEFTNNQSALAQPDSDTTLLKGDLSYAVLGENPGSPPSLGDKVSEKTDSCDSDSPFVPKLKRRRVSLTTTSASSCQAENVITDCSGHAKRLITSTEDADHDKSLANKSSGDGKSLGVNQQMNDTASVPDAAECSIGPVDQSAKLGSVSVDDISEHPVLVGLLSLECSFDKEPTEVTLPNEEYDVAGLSRHQETRTTEVQEDNNFSENPQLISSPDLDCAVTVMQKPEDATIFDVGSNGANFKDSCLDQLIVTQVGADAQTYRSSECADVADSSNVGSFISTSSGFHSTDVIKPVFDVSCPVGFGTNIDSVEGSPEVLSNGENYLSVDCSSKIIRKRKARGSQMGLSGTNTDVCAGVVTSFDGEIARDLAADASAMEVNFLDEKNSCKENDNLREWPSRIEYSIPEVNSGASGLFTGSQKKRKLSSSRSSYSSLSEDDAIAEGQTSNPPIPDQEWGAEGEVTSSASTAIEQCGTSDVEGKVGADKTCIVSLDENPDDYKSHGNDDLASITNSISLCADDDDYSSDSSDDLLISGLDMRSCMSSPEQRLAYSDLSLTGKTQVSSCLSENQKMWASANISKKKPLSADPNIFRPGKSLKAAANNLKTNTGIPPSQLKVTTQVVKKLNPGFGKLTWSRNQLTSTVPKVIPGQHPSNFGNSMKKCPLPASKPRTWHRTENSCVAVAEPKLQSSPILQSHNTAKTTQSSYVRKGNSLVRYPSVAGVTPRIRGSSRSVYRLSPVSMKNDQLSDLKTGDGDATTLMKIEQINTSKMIKTQSLNHSEKTLSCGPCNSREIMPVANPPKNSSNGTVDAPEERVKGSPVPNYQTGSVINSDIQSKIEEGNLEKIKYVKRRSNQLVAASNSNDLSTLGAGQNQASLSDGYYKRRQNQLVRASSKTHVKKGEANDNTLRLVPHSVLPKTSNRRQSGFSKNVRYSKFSHVWKLRDAQCSEKEKISLGPQKVWSHLYSLRRAAGWRRSLILGSKSNNIPFSSISQKLLLSRNRGAIYTRSTHGYSLRMSKVLSVGGSSLKWSKSIEKNARKANEDATKAVAAADKRKKEEKGAPSLVASKSKNHVSRKLVPSVKLRPGERIFRIGSERYKMDPTRRTLHRITAEKESTSSAALQSKKNVKKSYVPRRLLIGNEEYVRIGNGNQLVRDPKKRIRILASEKVRWSLRTARLRLARKRRYCQFFTRFGKCNKDEGKCPYIHDPSKIVVCTKFLSGSCSNPDCKLTHKVIPERMQDCSYFLKGSCSNESCPYRHVNVDLDAAVCESFLRGYCADGNECRKKHTYVCPDFEAKGICPQASTCKLHHPKKKTEKKLPTEQTTIVRGRYFDGGLIGLAECSEGTTEKPSTKGKADIDEGKWPDYISLAVSDDEVDVGEGKYPDYISLDVNGDVDEALR